MSQNEIQMENIPSNVVESLAQPSWKEKWQYAFDNYMSKGTPALIMGLAVISMLLIVGVSLFVWVTRTAPEEIDLPQLIWMSMMRTFDAGTMGGDTGSGLFLLSMLFVTMAGIFVISTLIGILSSGLDTKLAELRRGRSKVIERGHTVILGWNEQIFSILSELAIANQNVAKPCVVVLGNRDKTEMEEEIHERMSNLKHLRIVCRSGDALELVDLEMVNLNLAKSIIILSQQTEDADAGVIKTVLSIVRAPTRKAAPYHIIAQLLSEKNLEVARLVGGDEVEFILVGEIIARIMAQTCRQSGLSTVYTELMDFGGDEIYFKQEPDLVGSTYAHALLAYEDSTIIGLCHPASTPKLNPPMDMRIEQGTSIIAISADDDTIVLSSIMEKKIDMACIKQAQPMSLEAEHVLILGWNWRAPAIIKELDHYVTYGSKITVVANYPQEEGEEMLQLCTPFVRVKVNYQQGDITDRTTLDALPFERIGYVVLLAYADIYKAQQADSITLITLLQLRDIEDRYGYSFSIVSEMIDARNQRLAAVTHADDFVVSSLLVSLLISQIAEEKRLGAVFSDLFGNEGSEIYLKPVENYVQVDVALNFYTVIEAARQQGHTAIGYRVLAHAHHVQQAYGVVINPPKSKEIIFAAHDQIIVLAEE